MTVIGESSVLLQIKSIQLFGIKFSPINLNKKINLQLTAAKCRGETGLLCWFLFNESSVS